MTIRDAEPRDIPVILAIYNRAVRETTAAWTNQEETLDDRLNWFDARLRQDMPVLVAVNDADHAVGFASYGPFRPREGYRLTAEHSVFVEPACQGRGIGQDLLARIVTIAEAKGLHLLIGVVDGENAASIRLHEKLGFEVSGRLPQAGTKFGRWLDLVLMSKVLGPMKAPRV